MSNYNILTDLEKKGNPTLEVVLWLDHCSLRGESGAWKQMGDVTKMVPLRMYTVGWVLVEDKDKIIIASQGDREGSNVDGDILILKRLIVKRWKIKDPSMIRKARK